jgi:hypothetical protein
MIFRNNRQVLKMSKYTFHFDVDLRNRKTNGHKHPIIVDNRPRMEPGTI